MNTTMNAKNTPQDSRVTLGKAIGFAAFTWGYPLVEIIRTCHLQTQTSETSWSAPIDRLCHTRNVATDADRLVISPANDLLYTTGWINLADGPRLLHVPSKTFHKGRYFVLALYDAWTNNFANPGIGESPEEGEIILLVGPDVTPLPSFPEGRVIQAPSNLVWLISRVVAGAHDDVDKARALQNEITLSCVSGTDHGRVPHSVEHWVGSKDDTIGRLLQYPEQASEIAADFFTNLCRALNDQPVPVADQGMLSWLGQASLVPSANFSFDQLAEPLQAGLTQGLVNAAEWLEQGSRSRRAKPWILNFKIGNYGTQYATRAVTAFKGLGALDTKEAIYALSDFDANQQPLHGSKVYVQTFDAGDLPPVRGFWSLTMYDADRFLYGNALGRHSIGDRTPGLEFAQDGSLSIWIGHERPAHTANWLPSPKGSFYLVLRMYLPEGEVRTWRIPPIQVVADGTPTP